jgi:hypothetical protein
LCSQSSFPNGAELAVLLEPSSNILVLES